MKLLTAKQDLKLFQPTVVYAPSKLEVVEDLNVIIYDTCIKSNTLTFFAIAFTNAF